MAFRSFAQEPKSLRRALSIFILFLLSSGLLAQQDSLSVEKYFRWYPAEEDGLPDSSDFRLVDSSLNTWHREYYPTYPEFNNWLGNFGSSMIPMVADYSDEVGMDWQYDFLNPYRLEARNANYKISSQPFTKARYVLGSKREESLDIEHNQNLNEDLNVGAQIRRHSFEGWWERRKTVLNGFRVHTSMIGKRRYSFFGSASYNNTYNEENGGFSQLDPVAGQTTNLLDGKNTSIRQEIHLKQLWKFGEIQLDTILPDTIIVGDTNDPYAPPPDTIIKDTFRIVESIVGGPIIQNETRLQRSFYEYRDNSPEWNFYTSEFGLLPSGNVLHDREDVIHTFNKTTLLMENGMRFFLLGEFARWQDDLRNNVDRNLFGISLGMDWVQDLWEIGGSGTIAGWQFGDLHLKAALKPWKTENWNLRIVGRFDRSLPEMFLQLNGWTGTNTATRIGAELIQGRKMKVDIRYNLLDKITYLGNDALVNTSGQMSVLSASVQRQLDWKAFHINFKVLYQGVSDRRIIQVPELISFGSLYYEGKWFNGNMLARIGVDAHYGTTYEAPSYAPHLRWYFTQRGFLYGAYPIIDGYFTCRVNTGRFFVKATNLYYWNIPGEYFIAEGYPLNPFAIKFGFDWTFFN